MEKVFNANHSLELECLKEVIVRHDEVIHIVDVHPLFTHWKVFCRVATPRYEKYIFELIHGSMGKAPEGSPQRHFLEVLGWRNTRDKWSRMGVLEEPWDCNIRTFLEALPSR